MGKFVENVRNRLVKGPQQHGFDIDNWRSVYKSVAEPDEQDAALFSSGLWFAKHFENARRLTHEQADQLSLENPVEVIIGMLTQQWLSLNAEVSDAFKKFRGGVMYTEEVSEMRLQTGFGGTLDPQGAVEGLVDGSRFPLSYKINSPKGGTSSSGSGALTAIINMFVLGSFYNFLEQWWLECVWNDYRALEDDEAAYIEPCPWGCHRVDTVSQFRRESQAYERIQRGYMLWENQYSEDLKRVALNQRPFLRAFIRRGKIRLNVVEGTRAKNPMSTISLTRDLLTYEYLLPLYKKTLSKFAGLSLTQIMDVYQLFGQLPEQLPQFLPKLGEIKDIPTALRYAPRIEKQELKTALQRALGISDEQFVRLMAYMTFQGKVRDQLWFKPLVKISEALYSIALPAIDGVNFNRLIDELLKEIPDSEKAVGALFERHVRDELARSVESFPYGDRFKLCSDSLKFGVSKRESEEIDLAFVLGAKLFIGEAKSTIYSAEPIEKFNCLRRLEEGAMQAVRKANFVKKYMVEFLSTTGFDKRVSGGRIDVYPLVITNGKLFSGYEMNGVPVVELFSLTRFFSNNYIERNAYFEENGCLTPSEKLYLYQTEQQAIERIDSYLKSPPQISVYDSFLRLDDNEFRIPLVSGKPIRIREYRVHLPFSDLKEKVREHKISTDKWTPRSTG